MGDIMSRPDGALAGRTIAILIESDYVEPEVAYYQRRFAEEGARVEFLTRLWGQPSLTFHGHEYQAPFTVDGDLEAVDAERLAGIDALIVPSGMVSDRLRYTEDVNLQSPAVRLLRAAFEDPSVLKGVICHGMWLVSPIADVVAGRRVTCHNNLVSDVRNMGALYTDQDVVVDQDLVTARSADHCHLFARMIIDLVVARDAVRQNGHRPHTSVAAAVEAPVETPSVKAPSVETAGVSAQPEGMDFTFSDLVVGQVVAFHTDNGLLELTAGDGRLLRTRVSETTSAEYLRNLGTPYLDAKGHLAELLVPGTEVFAHGIYYPGTRSWFDFDVKRLLFLGRRPGEYEFAAPDWWVDQISELGRFYRRSQFGGSGTIDFAEYRTVLRLGGDKGVYGVQETDTISRLVYGMSSAFLLTGNEDFLDVAERGAEYLRQHMRFVDRDEDVVYWYHGVDLTGGSEKKLFTSEFGDDYDAIPMYEQIYALAGPTQLYRVTGDPRISSDIDATLRLFQRFFRDPERGGYYSHIDPITLSPHHVSLGHNQSRKNWNSVGDHAPAYLINLFLATGDDRHRAMLEETFDLIVEHMPRADSPFVQERFHADWSPDQGWGWQQNRAVVGHNLKIAWNLMRMMSVAPKEGYRLLAEEIGRKMPALGSDMRRGGWYDVVERTLDEGETRHRFTWHDRKAWWQQEQSILAYQILSGITGDQQFLHEARKAAAFYNAFFLDHDEGGVYFNVLADGIPYLLGQERLKGSHSMSMCHAAELCYLATVYERLLLSKEPLTMHFRPRPDGFPDRVLRVAPDALPPGSVRLEWVEVDGRPYDAFDPDALTVKLPDSGSAVAVRAHLAPEVGG